MMKYNFFFQVGRKDCYKEKVSSLEKGELGAVNCE